MRNIKKSILLISCMLIAVMLLTGCSSRAERAYEKGLKAMEDGDYKEAKGHFNKVIRTAGNNSDDARVLIDACYMKGECLRILGDEDGAKAAFDKAIEEDTKSRSFSVERTSVTCLRRGLVYRDRGDYNEAITAFKDGLKLEERHAEQELMANLIWCLEESGDTDEAFRYLQTYTSKYPQDENMMKEYNFLKSRMY